MTLLLKNRSKIFFLTLSTFVFFISFQFNVTAQNAMQVAGTPTETATQSGNWMDATTWGGSLPSTDARILIPAGITVTVDAEIATEFKSVRIDGTLKFASTVNTELRTEYLFGGMMSRLEIGTASNPIAQNVTAQLVFADRGGTTTAQDPDRFAPGAMFMGSVEMRGETKTSWTTLATQPAAGATSLTLATTPQNWKVGDKLVVAATTIGNPESDDLVEITSISGRTIQINEPLQYSHKAPAQASDLAVHIANLTRNIKISSENPSVSAKRRGHLMFMHNLNVDLRYVELTNTGRTDKTKKIDDYSWDELQESPNYQPPRGAFTNPRGRYSIHFHRGGINPSLTPAHVEGVTVNNDPGWGFVNHSSRVNFIRNVSYDVVGSAFCTESGDETGSFIENIALRTVNPSDPFANPRNENALLDEREDVQDFAWQGDAFWFHSTGISVEGNVAAGVSGHAFIFWPEGLIENGLGMMRGTPNIHISNPAQAALLEDVPNDFVLECWFIPQKSFKDNTVYTATKGLTVFYLHTRFLDEIEEKYNVPTEIYRSSLNAIFDGTTIWNINYKGIDMFFSSDITIQNSRIVGYGSAANAVGMNLDHFHNLDDWYFLNNKVEGFNNNNIGLSPPTNAKVTIDGGNYNNSATDIRIRETNFTVEEEEEEEEESNNTPNRTMTISNMAFSNPNKNIVLQPEFTLNQPPEDGFDFAEDIKNELYFGLNDHITLNYGPFQNATLYFDEQAPNFIPITNANYKPEELPDEPTGVSIPSRFRNKTNAQLQTIFNPSSSFGGELLPATAVSHPSIVGGKVSAISDTPDQFTLTVSTVGNGTTSLNPAGGIYNEGTTVTITATANLNAQFDNWTGALSGTNNPITITMDGNKTVTANFSETSTGNCQPDYLFINNRGLSGTADGIQNLESNGGIESTQSLAVDANITYDSKVQITLQPGFHAIAGSTFRAMIDGCTIAEITNNEISSLSTIEQASLEEEKTLLSKKEDKLNYKQELLPFQKSVVSPLFKLFPNPTKGQFNINTSLEDYSIQIFSLSGKLLLDLSHQINPKTVNISDFPTGMYLVKMVDNQGRKRDFQKIIKSK